MNKICLICIMVFQTILLHAQQWTIFNTTNSDIPDNHVSNLDLFNGGAWMATSNGVGYFDGSSWTNYNTSNSELLDPIITDISVAEDGSVWIWNFDDGAASFDGVSWTNFTTSNSPLSSGSGSNVNAHYDDKIIFGTYEGLNILENSTWTIFNETNSDIPDNDVREVMYDNAGNLWVTTFGGGVGMLNESNWTNYTTLNSGLPDDDVFCITIDNQQNKWFGTFNGGLARFDGTTWTVYNVGNSAIPENDIRSVVADVNGTLIVATRHNGFATFDGNVWTPYNISNSELPSNEVWDLDISDNGNLWLSTSLGAVMIESFATPTILDELDEAMNGTISLYPNPASQLAYLRFDPFYSGELLIQIRNISGQIVYEMTFADLQKTLAAELRLPELVNGIYLVNIKGLTQSVNLALAIH